MLPLIHPNIAFDEVAGDIRSILDSGMLTNGERVRLFERMTADIVGVPYAFATTSATAALHLVMLAAGITPGDEVMVSDFTFPASGNAICQTGAVPVLVDCRQGAFDLDVDEVESKITVRTKAIMVVDPFGQPAQLDRLELLAERHGLALIEDAACALGSRLGPRMCGGFGLAGCFSFHPRKLITTGEGGMITTRNSELARRIGILRNHGAIAGDVGLIFIENGFNYRLSEIQAALGIAQLRRLDSIIADRRAGFARYQAHLSRIEGVRIPLSATPSECNFQSLVILLDDGIHRDKVVALMRKSAIETTLGTYAQHAHPAFARFGYTPGALPNAYKAQRQSLTLPLLFGMSDEVIEGVVTDLAAAISMARSY